MIETQNLCSEALPNPPEQYQKATLPAFCEVLFILNTFSQHFNPPALRGPSHRRTAKPTQTEKTLAPGPSQEGHLFSNPENPKDVKMGSLKLPEINKDLSLDPNVSFLVLPRAQNRLGVLEAAEVEAPGVPNGRHQK